MPVEKDEKIKKVILTLNIKDVDKKEKKDIEKKEKENPPPKINDGGYIWTG